MSLPDIFEIEPEKMKHMLRRNTIFNNIFEFGIFQGKLSARFCSLDHKLQFSTPFCNELVMLTYFLIV